MNPRTPPAQPEKKRPKGRETKAVKADPPVKAGDWIRSTVHLVGGGSFDGPLVQVKYMSGSIPVVRYRFGKVDKPVNHWTLARIA